MNLDIGHSELSGLLCEIREAGFRAQCRQAEFFADLEQRLFDAAGATDEERIAFWNEQLDKAFR